MHTVKIGEKEFDLKAIENDCWLRITSAVSNNKDHFHYTTVANVNRHGANMRMVVLRDADSSKKELVFHTDIRSGKWQDLQKDNHISFLFYHPSDRLQIRLTGKAFLHEAGQVTDDAWAKCSLSTRKTYLGEVSPSTISAKPTSGLPAIFDNERPTQKQSEAGRKNFGVVAAEINWMEWVKLRSEGNLRAVFHYTDQRDFKATWLVP